MSLTPPATQGTTVALLPFGPETDVRGQQSMKFHQDRSAGCALLSNTPICCRLLAIARTTLQAGLRAPAAYQPRPEIGASRRSREKTSTFQQLSTGIE